MTDITLVRKCGKLLGQMRSKDTYLTDITMLTIIIISYHSSFIQIRVEKP